MSLHGNENSNCCQVWQNQTQKSFFEEAQATLFEPWEETSEEM